MQTTYTQQFLKYTMQTMLRTDNAMMVYMTSLQVPIYVHELVHLEQRKLRFNEARVSQSHGHFSEAQFVNPKLAFELSFSEMHILCRTAR